jgi:hypothetical protein
MALGTESDGLDASSATGLPGSASLVRFDIPIDGWRDIGKSEKQSRQSTSNFIKGVADVIISRNKGLASSTS